MTVLHLVDATYELFRAHFAMPSLSAPDGREVGALRGLTQNLLSMLQNEDVTHVACATDHTVTSWRNDEWEGYKTGEDVEQELLDQFEPAEDAIRALGVTLWPMEEFEADDAIGAAVKKWRGRFDQVRICSPDKDFAQCVDGERVVLVDRRRDIVYDRAGVREKWGVEPGSIPDWLALVGDAADGLPGVPRWGAKSAATVLAEYGSIEAIPDDPGDWTVKVRGAAGLADNLREHRDDALLWKRLATLRTDAPVPGGKTDLRWRGVPRDAFETFCAAHGFERLLDRVQRWA